MLGHQHDIYVWNGDAWSRPYAPFLRNVPGFYEEKGTLSTESFPGSREGALAWIDENIEKRLWIFGGYGFGYTAGTNPLTAMGYLSDLWCYDTQIGQWAWLAGNGTVNVTHTSDNPSARASVGSWITADKIWIFGGQSAMGQTNLLSSTELFIKGVTRTSGGLILSRISGL